MSKRTVNIQWSSLMQYHSHVLHLLLPICQTFAPLLLLSESFLSLSSEILVFDDFADLLASFGGAFSVAHPLIGIFCIALFRIQKDPLDTGATKAIREEQIKTSAVTFSLLSDSQIQSYTCFFCSCGVFFSSVSDLELKSERSKILVR